MRGPKKNNGNGGASDTTPDAFTFTPVTTADLGQPYTSNTVTIAGINATASGTVSGGTVSKNGGAFSSAAFTVVNGDTLAAKGTASSEGNQTVNVQVTVGGTLGIYAITTLPAADTTPDAFSFTDATEQALNTVVQSNTITPTGFTAAVAITASGLEYSIDGGSYTSAAGTFSPGSTLRVRKTSSASNSTTVSGSVTLGGVTGTFSVRTLAADPPGTLVTTQSELFAAINAAVAGDTIRVAAGDYPFTLVQGKVFASDVTIKASNPAAKPVFAGLHFKNCTHIKVQDIESTMSPAPRYGISVQSCTDMTVTGCLARGSSEEAYADDAHGFWLRNSQRITVTGCEAKWLEFGMAHLDCDDIEFSGNTIHDIQSDGIQGGGSNGVTIDANLFYDFYPLTDHHPDAVQFWTTNVTRLTEDITVTNNLYYRGAGTMSQGIFFRDQIGTGYKNVTVTGNAMVGCMPHGICVAGLSPSPLAEGCVVNDNFVLGFSDGRSWLRLASTTGASYANNEYSYLNNATNTSLTDGGGNVKLTEATTPGDYTLLDAWLVDHPDVPTRV